MVDESDPYRDAIHTVIQDNRPGEGEPALLVGWALVAEWMSPAGEKFLARAHSASLPFWGAQGLHHEALYGNWKDTDD